MVQRGQWEERRKKKRKRERDATQIYTDDDVITGRGRSIELWVYGGCCLGNRPIGCAAVTVAYVMSQVSVLTIAMK